VWDYPFGILQFRFLTPVGCWHTAWNKSEDQIVGAYEDGVVRIWELRLGKPRLDLPSPSESGPLVGFAYWPDDDHVSATYANQRLTWNRTSGQLIPADQISRLPPGPEDQQFAISANSDDGRRTACIADGQVAIVDVATGEETLRLDIGTGDHKFRFAPDGTALVADNHFDGGLYYWPGKR
jgi:WD40 repeat protein